MTDFYSELNIDKTCSIDEINKQLSKLESTWKRREITNPEKATTMLALIIQARKVFASENSRKQYDIELAKSNREPVDPQEERYSELYKWQEQAMSYYNTGQYDLAKVAIDKALSCNGLDDNDALFCLTADIYRESGNNSAAMEYINKAIVLSPDVATYYLSKALIYNELSLETRKYNYIKANEYDEKMRDTFRLAASKAQAIGDVDSQAKALGALARVLYFQNPTDKSQAELLAHQTIELGGDPWGNAQKVLDDITVIENERCESIYKEASKDSNCSEIDRLERAAELFDSISNYKDSAQKAASCREKAEKIKKWDQEEKERERKRREDEKIELERKAEQERILEEKRSKIMKKVRLVVAAVIAVVVFLALIYTKVIAPRQEEKRKETQYINANALLEQKEYENAIQEFQKLNGYKDSMKKIREANSFLKEEKYREALSLKDEGKYEDAKSAFVELGDYEDSVENLDQLLQAQYDLADKEYQAGNYEKSIELFQELGDYNDAERRIEYIEAEKLVKDGKLAAAAIAFCNIENDPEAQQRGMELWDEVIVSRRKPVTVNRDDNDGSYVFAITNDGHVKVVSSGDEGYGKCNVSEWNNIVQISASAWHTAGLRADGTVLAVGRESDRRCDVNNWTDVIEISASTDYTAALLSDGTVVTTDNRWEDELSTWSDIVEISASDSHMLGLKSNGTVVAVGDGDCCNVDEWSGIIQIYAEYRISMGLRVNGTCITAGDNYGFGFDEQAINNEWNDIVSCETHANFVGLKSDGTLIQDADREDDFYHPELSSWNNIIYFSKGLHVIAGVQRDGTILVCGTNKRSFKGDVSVLNDIRFVEKTY